MSLRRPLLCLAGLTLGAALSGASFNVAISDLLAEHVREPIQAYTQNRDSEVEVQSMGSLPAMDELRDDAVDLAVVAVPIGRNVPREEFRTFPLAYDIAVVAVNVSNPIEEISVPDLAGIFGVEEGTSHSSWGELGLSGWGGRKIKPLAASGNEGVSLELFKYMTLGGGALKQNVGLVGPSEAVNQVAADSTAIAVLPSAPDGSQVKTLLVSSDPETTAFGPMPENVHNGDYPIRLPFYLVFKEQNAQRVRPLLRVLLGDDVALALRDNEIMPLPDTVRRKFLIDLDLADSRGQ